jgi:hypothetical protein
MAREGPVADGGRVGGEGTEGVARGFAGAGRDRPEGPRELILGPWAFAPAPTGLPNVATANSRAAG